LRHDAELHVQHLGEAVFRDVVPDRTIDVGLIHSLVIVYTALTVLVPQAHARDQSRSRAASDNGRGDDHLGGREVIEQNRGTASAKW